MEDFVISKEKEEQKAFKQIMNIPMHIQAGHQHPTLNETVYKGSDFRLHAQLYQDIQKVTNDPDNDFKERIMQIKIQLEDLEANVINRTKASITMGEQIAGKLISRSAREAQKINEASLAFFTLINEICRKVGLAKKVNVVPMGNINSKRTAAAKENNMISTMSFALSKQLDDTYKRSKLICQRVGIMLRTFLNIQSRIRNRRTCSKQLTRHVRKANRNLNKIKV